MAFVPEERLGRGAVPEMSLAENALLTGPPPGADPRTASSVPTPVRAFAAGHDRRASASRRRGPDATARSLSGGNLQKFIVGREILQRPQRDDRRAADLGRGRRRRGAHPQALVDLRDEGVAVLVVSEELDELFEICDRLAVIARGRLSPPRPARETNAEEIGLLMSGSFIGAQGIAARRGFVHRT